MDDPDAMEALFLACGLSDDQRDELAALYSMFESDLVLNDDASVEIRVEIDSGDLPDVRLAMEFPASYPAQMAPSFSVRSAVKLSPSEVEFVHSSLTGLFEPGEPVVYEWVLWLQDNAPSLPSFQRESDSIRGALAAVADAESLEVKANKLSTTVADEPEIDNQSNGAEEPRSERTVRTKEGPVGVADCGIEIYHGPTFTDRKSVFQAHLAAVESTQDVRRVMAALLQDRKLQRATHNISAYRIFDKRRQVWIQDNDDDGESAAGRRMAHLLSMMDVANVLVVVSRWYGGIHLGPARFKIINNLTREALIECGYASSPSNSNTPKGAKKKKK